MRKSKRRRKSEWKEVVKLSKTNGYSAAQNSEVNSQLSKVSDDVISNNGSPSLRSGGRDGFWKLLREHSFQVLGGTWNVVTDVL